ncbi:MAG: hypothetical protein F2827_05940 [Actinobacteria bacterium]|nr:hypothetical protein [Actinomycetota bacterium]
MAIRNTTFTGARALGLVVVLGSSREKKTLQALRLAVESALLPRVLVVLDAVAFSAPLKLKIPTVLAGRDPHVGVLVVRDALGSPYAAGVGGSALGVPRLSEQRSDEELRDEALRAIVDALREPAVFYATWGSFSGETWRAVSSIGLFRGVLGGFTRQATADQAGRLAELLEGQQLETNAGSTRYSELAPELAGVAVPQYGYDSVIPPHASQAREVYEQSYSAARTASGALEGLLGDKHKNWFPFMWSKWVGFMLVPWHTRMGKLIIAAQQIRQARALQDEILSKADFSHGVDISKVEVARRVGVEVITLLPEKYDVVANLREEVLNAFADIRQLRAPLLAALDFRKKARVTRPRSPSEARQQLTALIAAQGIERGLETIEQYTLEYTPGSAASGTLGLWARTSEKKFPIRFVEAVLITGPRRQGAADALKLLFGVVLLIALGLVGVQVLARVLEVGWPALKVNWANGRLDLIGSVLLDWLYVVLPVYLVTAVAVTGIFVASRTFATRATSWVGSIFAQVYRRSLEVMIFFGLLKSAGLLATEVLGRTVWATKVPPLDRCPDPSLRGVSGELCRVGSEALDRLLWFSPQGQHLGHYALQGLGVAALLMLLTLAIFTRGRKEWQKVLELDGVASLALLPSEEARLGGNPLWAAWANIIYNDWHHASFRSHASEIFAISAQTVTNWSLVSAARLRDVQGWLSQKDEVSTALEQFHSPAFETVLDHVGRGGEYAGYVSGLNLMAADVGLIGSRSMDLQWERMRGPARIGLPKEVAIQADESLKSYLAALASSDLLHRAVREAAPAAEDDDVHARLVFQLEQDLRDAWGSSAVLSTLNNQVFSRDDQHGSHRIIQFVSPEEFFLLDTRDTEPPVIRFAPHGAAEELRIENLIATQSFTSAGSIRLIPFVESAWIYSDEFASENKFDSKRNKQIQRWLPRAGIVAEVLNTFGSSVEVPRVRYLIPEDDSDILGQPETLEPTEIEATEAPIAFEATEENQTKETPTDGNGDEVQSTDNYPLVGGQISNDGQAADSDPIILTAEDAAPSDDLSVKEKNAATPSLTQRFFQFLQRLVQKNEGADEVAEEVAASIKSAKKRQPRKRRKTAAQTSVETLEASASKELSASSPSKKRRRGAKRESA